MRDRAETLLQPQVKVLRAQPRGRVGGVQKHVCDRLVVYFRSRFGSNFYDGKVIGLSCLTSIAFLTATLSSKFSFSQCITHMVICTGVEMSLLILTRTWVLKLWERGGDLLGCRYVM